MKEGIQLWFVIGMSYGLITSLDEKHERGEALNDEDWNRIRDTRETVKRVLAGKSTPNEDAAIEKAMELFADIMEQEAQR